MRSTRALRGATMRGVVPRDELRLPRCTLRRWREDDVDSLVRHADDPAVAGNLRDGFPHPYTLEHAAAWIGRAALQEPLHAFAIEVEGAAVGGIGVEPLDDVCRHSGELGYWLGRAFWNRGIATEATRAITEYAFRDLELVRVQTGVFSWNPASMRVLEKCGFVREGLQRQAAFKHGRFGDIVLFAKLRA